MNVVILDTGCANLHSVKAAIAIVPSCISTGSERATVTGASSVQGIT